MQKSRKLGFKFLVLFYLNISAIKPDIFIWYIALRFYTLISRSFKHVRSFGNKH